MGIAFYSERGCTRKCGVLVRRATVVNTDEIAFGEATKSTCHSLNMSRGSISRETEKKQKLDSENQTKSNHAPLREQQRR